MNTDVWGTCNTDTSQVQCDANISWFASSLQASCQTDLVNQVETAVMTLNGDYHIGRIPIVSLTNSVYVFLN